MDRSELLQIIGKRQGGSIKTALTMIRGLLPCLQNEQCAEQFFGMGSLKQWQLALSKAADDLVYSDSSLLVLGGHKDQDTTFGEPEIKGTRELTPGALMEFDCVLTSTRQDRDGDILESKGAELDPSMPLLWQHIPMMPCGKLVKVLVHNSKRVVTRFAVADTDLGNDVATLVDFGVLRISHGFIPTEYEPLEEKDKHGWPVGFHVTKFKILEGSVVSVPSNEDAVILASHRAKLHNPLVKAWADDLWQSLPESVRSGWESEYARRSKDSGHAQHHPASGTAGTSAILDSVTDPGKSRSHQTGQAPLEGVQGGKRPCQGHCGTDHLPGGKPSTDPGNGGSQRGRGGHVPDGTTPGTGSSHHLSKWLGAVPGGEGRHHGGNPGTQPDGRGGSCQLAGVAVGADRKDGSATVSGTDALIHKCSCQKDLPTELSDSEMASLLDAEVATSTRSSNEHVCVVSTKAHAKYRRQNKKTDEGKSYGLLFGQLKDSDKWELVSIHFPKKDWTADEAKAHCKKDGGTFTPASASTSGTGKGVIPYSATSKADESRAWDAGAAIKRIKEWAGLNGDNPPASAWTRYGKAFTYSTGDGNKQGDFHLPHHDVEDGHLVVVWHGVSAAGAAIQGARGASIPESVIAGSKAHLAKHYKQFGKEPPWSSDDGKSNEGNVMTVELEVKGRMSKSDITHLKAAMDHHQTIMDHESCPKAVHTLIHKAHGCVKSVHDRHNLEDDDGDEDDKGFATAPDLAVKGKLSDGDMEKLKTAMEHHKAAMDHDAMPKALHAFCMKAYKNVKAVHDRHDDGMDEDYDTDTDSTNSGTDKGAEAQVTRVIGLLLAGKAVDPGLLEQLRDVTEDRLKASADDYLASLLS